MVQHTDWPNIAKLLNKVWRQSDPEFVKQYVIVDSSFKSVLFIAFSNLLTKYPFS